jgi:acyl CoA:acetate/3-ketoacid CoA transferase beta subunit
MIFTDIAVIDVTEQGLVLKETAPGWSAEEVQALTEPTLIIDPDLRDIEL